MEIMRNTQSLVNELQREKEIGTCYKEYEEWGGEHFIGKLFPETPEKSSKWKLVQTQIETVSKMYPDHEITFLFVDDDPLDRILEGIQEGWKVSTIPENVTKLQLVKFAPGYFLTAPWKEKLSFTIYEFPRPDDTQTDVVETSIQSMEPSETSFASRL